MELFIVRSLVTALLILAMIFPKGLAVFESSIVIALFLIVLFIATRYDLLVSLIITIIIMLAVTYTSSMHIRKLRKQKPHKDEEMTDVIDATNGNEGNTYNESPVTYQEEKPIDQKFLFTDNGIADGYEYAKPDTYQYI